MSHWFHRNSIKASNHIDFERRTFPSSSDSQLICSLLKQSRANLLKLHSEPTSNVESVQGEFNTYVSLLLGFINDCSERTNGDSKLRYSFKSKWTQTLGASFIHEEQDAVFEMASIIINNAIWLTKHAAYVAAIADEYEPTENQAKDVHKSLKIAAGQFKFVQENIINKLLKSGNKNVLPFYDAEEIILSTYINQCKAEAQEVTIARAIELKHSPSLISSIAHSTSILFQTASDSIANLDKTACEKWCKYLALKSRFYKAHAYCYFGLALLAQDKCGEAIKCLQESQKYFEETEKLCKLYANTKGVGTQAIPERHQFFKNLASIIARTTEKCDRENGMIYHQKLPLETPILDTKAVLGLAEPEEYVFPKLHELWTPVNYNAFNLAKGVDIKDKSGSDKASVQPPKETPIPQGNADPKSISGCLIS